MTRLFAELLKHYLTSRSEAVSKPAESNLEVVLSKGARIGVRPGFDPATLRELIQALEQA